MAQTIKDFLFGLGFKVDEAGLKKFNNGIFKATKTVTALGAAAVAATGIITKFVSGVAKDFNQLSLLSKRVNASARELSEWGFIASVTGSSAEAMRVSFDRLNRTAGEAALGIGRGATAFKDLGLNARKQNGELKKTSEIMEEVGNKIRDFSQQEQIAVLTRLGIDPTVVGALTGDVSELRAEFEALYSGIDINEAAQSSEEFTDSITRLSFAFKAVKDSIALQFIPQIKIGIDALRKFITENSKKIIAALSPIISVILKITQVFMILVSRVAQLASKIVTWFVKLNDVTNGWSTIIIGAVAAWRLLNLAFLASPVGILLSLVAAFALLIDDFLTFRDGGESLIDWGSTFGKTLAIATGLAIGLSAAFTIVKSSLAAVRTAMILLNLVMFANPIGILIAAIVAGVALVIAAGYLLVKNWKTVEGWFASFFDWMTGGLEKIVGVIDRAVESVKGFFGVDDSEGASAKRDEFASFTRRGRDIGAGAFPSFADSSFAGGGGSSNISQNTTITVQGSGSPESTARAVASEQGRVNADMTRNMRGELR